MADITMYTSAVCPYCSAAKRLLAAKGVSYEEIAVHLDPDARARLVELTGRPTVPQILVDDAPIGGFDEMRQLDREGRLDALLAGER